MPSSKFSLTCKSLKMVLVTLLSCVLMPVGPAFSKSEPTKMTKRKCANQAEMLKIGINPSTGMLATTELARFEEILNRVPIEAVGLVSFVIAAPETSAELVAQRQEAYASAYKAAAAAVGEKKTAWAGIKPDNSSGLHVTIHHNMCQTAASLYDDFDPQRPNSPTSMRARSLSLGISTPCSVGETRAATVIRPFNVYVAYPARAKSQKQEGVIQAGVLVDASGIPRSVEILAAAPPGVFEANVINQALKMRFDHACISGSPTQSYYVLTINFKL